MKILTLIVLALTLLSFRCFAYESTEQIYIGSQEYDGYTTWYVEPDTTDYTYIPEWEQSTVIDLDGVRFIYEEEEYDNLKDPIEHLINQIESLRATQL